MTSSKSPEPYDTEVKQKGTIYKFRTPGEPGTTRAEIYSTPGGTPEQKGFYDTKMYCSTKGE